MKKRHWINVYVAGIYHAANKPGTENRHGGDIYVSEAVARQAIHPRSHYVATVPIEFDDVSDNS